MEECLHEELLHHIEKFRKILFGILKEDNFKEKYLNSQKSIEYYLSQFD